MRKIISYLLRTLGFFILIMICGCCASSPEVIKYKAVENLAKEKFGENYIVEENVAGSFFLCFKRKETKNRLHNSLHYFVYDVKSEKIIQEEKLYYSEVKWIDEFNIEIKLTPEIISGDEDETAFIFNVITKEKQKKN